MESKTPKFDKAINEILKNLVPHSKECGQCGSVFEILENDIEFFNKFQVPPPQMCPDCRRQRRLAFANYTTLFKRPCSVPGHTESMISSVPDGAKFPVFDFDYYWSDDRDGKDYGLDPNLDKSFLKQFEDLFTISPQPALNRDPASINSEYTSYGAQLKDCYYTFGGMAAEDIMYTVWPLSSKNCVDMFIALNTESSYQGVFPDHCYDCKFVYFSKDCINCDFIYDCRNCSDCFGCVNLRNKKFCMWNEQLSEEDYRKKRLEINLGDRGELNKHQAKFTELIKTLPVRATRNEHSTNAVGNYLINSNSCLSTMWAIHSENLSYVDFVMKVRDSYDASISANSEKLYSTVTVGSNSSNVKFSNFGRDLRDCEYTMSCKSCVNCFACIGLDNAKFCIFNKQYTEEEYWQTVDELKTKMLADGEYGEFFPMSLSPFPYNASLSNIIYSIPKEKVLSMGGWWHDEENNIPKDVELVEYDKTEPDIKNVSDAILKQGIKSRGSGKPFRIVQKELDFYRRKNVAIPELTPYERIINRFSFVNNFKLVKDNCFNCKMEILSSCESDAGYKPYCEKCYQQEVY